ncbi:MAG: PhzF family phenazine biosynthesis protein [Idiomarina sp.]|nr:PhzF family phenazine biosynthesis protein [Idiomarina sp.]
MDIKIYQVDAFTDRVFGGNPAAVCPLGGWPEDDLLQAIAEENNLSETAFFVADGSQFHLRWFTPEAEVDLCGHATLAAAHVLFHHLKYNQPEIQFRTRSGELRVALTELGIAMNFPASMPHTVAEPPQALLDGLCLQDEQRSNARVFAAYDYIVELGSEAEVRKLAPDFAKLSELDGRGVVITAPGNTHDFVSRCFFPKLRVNEDPVTGSAHCELAPFWAEKLGKETVTGAQLSRRGGIVHCAMVRTAPAPELSPDQPRSSDRVILSGSAADYMQGMITIP